MDSVRTPQSGPVTQNQKLRDIQLFPLKGFRPDQNQESLDWTGPEAAEGAGMLG